MKAVVTALVIVIAPGFLLGCASSGPSSGPQSSGKENQSATYDSDWSECRRQAMIDALMLPAPQQGGSASTSSGSGTPLGKEGFENRGVDPITRHCMEIRGHTVLPGPVSK